MKGLTVSSSHPRYHRAYTTDDSDPGGGNRNYPDLNDFEAMAEDYLKDNLGLTLEVRSLIRSFGFALLNSSDKLGEQIMPV